MSATDQDDAALERLMALDLAWAEAAHARAMAAETAEDTERLGRTYQRAARSLRQTIALKADLRRKREAAERAPKPAAPAFATEEELLADERVEELCDAVGRVIAAHHRDDTRRQRIAWGRFDRESSDWSVDDILEIEDLDEHVLEVCRNLGLPDHLAQTWRDLPEPEAFHDPYEDGEEEEEEDEPPAWTSPGFENTG